MISRLLLLTIFLFSIESFSQNATIWSSDFSNPSDWVSTTDGSLSDSWTIGTNGPSGSFAIFAIESLTANNGFALFDSDLSCSGNQIVNLTMTGSANCSELDLVELRFFEFYRRFNDSTFVFVSANGGVDWTKFSVNSFFSTNGTSDNPQQIRIDLSSVAAHSAEVKIRFQYWSPADYEGPANGGPGCGYAWMIDDVSIGPPANKVNGHVFLDQNANSIYDSGEYYLPNYPILVNSTTTFTNAFGYYELEVTGSDILVQPGTPYSEAQSSPSSGTLLYTQPYGEVQTQDFAITYTGTSTNATIEAYSIGPLRPGFNYYNAAIVTNEGLLPVSMDLEAIIPSQLSFSLISSVGNIISQNETSVLLNIGPVPPLYSDIIYTASHLVSPPPLVEIGDELEFEFEISNLSETETNTSDNIFIYHETAVGAFDPNDILMLKGSSQTPDFIDSGEYFTYRIRFQNSGNYPTSFISIEDSLSQLLDWSTFKPIAASHSVQVSIDENGNVLYFFPDIQLLPEEENEELSMGYVIYKIKPLSTVDLGDIITNQAFIYFDYNPPIITNVDTVRIEIPTTISAENDPTLFFVYPNPVSEIVKLKINSTSFSISQNDIFSIYNFQGKRMKSGQLAELINGINTTHFSDGIYSLVIETGKEILNSNFVVNKE